MSLDRLSRILLSACVLCLALGIAGGLFSVSRIDRQHVELQRLTALQGDLNALSAGADAIALFGADRALIDAYVQDARRLQAALEELGRDHADARQGARAIELLLSDLDALADAGGAANLPAMADRDAAGFASVVRLSNIASHGMVLDAAISDAAEATHERMRQQARLVSAGPALLAVVVLLGAVGSAGLVHLRIVRPLRELAGTIRRVEAGELGARADDRRKDEIGEVGGAFNSLIERRLAAETRLARSQALLRMAGEIARFGGWRYDARTDRLELTDETAMIHDEPEGFRPSLKQALGYYAPQDRERMSSLLSGCLDQGASFDAHFDLVTAKGREIRVRCACEPLRDQAGRIIGAQGAFQDVTDLLEARSEAERRNAQLQVVIASMADGFLAIDRDWCFAYHNEKALELMGRRGEILVGRNVWQTFPEARGTPIEHACRRAMKTGESQSFQEFYAPLGRWFDINAHPTPEGLAVYFRDFTAEHARQEQLRLLESAIDRTNDVVLITEATPIDGPDHPRIVYANAAFERRTGYTRAEALAATPRILQGPETGLAALDRIRAALKAFEPVRAELVNYTKSGEPFWWEIEIAPVADAEGRFTHFIAVQRDITGRKRDEERLRISEERFRLVSEASRDVVFDTDPESGACWISDNYATMIGAPPAVPCALLDDLAGRVSEDERAQFRQSVDAVLDGTAESARLELRLRRDDGRERLFELQASAIRGADGKARRIVGGLTDVTEARELDRRMLDAQKIEALGELTGGVAHDFNNLLTIILGNADFLIEAVPDGPQRQQARAILGAAERGASLTANLLAFARRQPLSPAPVDVNALIRDTLPLLRQMLTESERIELDLRAGNPVATVDPSKLQTALMNLVVNAHHAIGEHGTITIETDETVLDGAAAQGAEVTPGAYLVIAISDDGEGMSQEVRDHVFEPFFTTKPPGMGTGLGLSSVYGFVKQSAGHAKVYSEPGVGTTVKLFLPSSAQPAAAPPVEHGDEAPAGRGETILVVEDDAVLRRNVARYVDRLGYRVIVAGDGAEALSKLDATPDIDLLFTDMVMPGGMNGRQLAEAALDRQPGLAILYTSGYTKGAIDNRGQVEPAADLLSKPYRLADLARALRRAFEGRFR